MRISTTGGERPARYGEVLAVPEFRALFAAQVLSVSGDQIAKIALALLVFQETASPLLASLTYALTYLPWVVGPILSGLADRRPRRTLMVQCDVARALLIGAMAIPGVPTGVLLALLLLASLLTPVFEAARGSTLPDVLFGDTYVVGSGLSLLVFQVAQVAGFALGGAIIAVLSARGALALDALTFLLSAVILRAGLRAHDPRLVGGRHHVGEETGRWLRDTARGLSTVFGSPVLRFLVLLAWVGSAAIIVPETLAVIYASDTGGGAVTAGLLTATLPLGNAIGVVMLTRLARPHRRHQLFVPLALLGCLLLLLTPILSGNLVALGVLWAVAGAASSYITPVAATFMATVRPQLRARAFGVAAAGMQLAQGAAVALAGFAAERIDIPLVVAGAGCLGVLAVAVLTVLRPRGFEQLTLSANEGPPPAGAPDPTRSSDPAPLSDPAVSTVESDDSSIDPTRPTLL